MSKYIALFSMLFACLSCSNDVNNEEPVPTFSDVSGSSVVDSGCVKTLADFEVLYGDSEVVVFGQIRDEKNEVINIEKHRWSGFLTLTLMYRQSSNHCTHFTEISP